MQGKYPNEHLFLFRNPQKNKNTFSTLHSTFQFAKLSGDLPKTKTVSNLETETRARKIDSVL